MRILAMTAVCLAGAATLSACATSGQPNPTYGEALAQLSADCQARGGTITPIPNATTGRPNTDYACDIRGGPSARLRGDR